MTADKTKEGSNHEVSNDELSLLFESLGSQILEENPGAVSVARMLRTETLKFRDKLKAENSQILTVADTRTALDALEASLRGDKLPKDLSAEQKALARILIDRVELFGA